MKQWALTLPLILGLAGTTACGSSTSKPQGAAGHAGTAGAGTAGAGGGTSGTGGTGGAGGDEHALLPGMTGYVQDDMLGIKGAWYAYADSLGMTGAHPGDCDGALPLNGGHMASECSNVVAPLAGSFNNVMGQMQTTGTVEVVLAKSGTTGCPPPTGGTDNCDYSKMWGAGIGLDLNNAGGDAGVQMPYDATANHVIGIAFDLALTDDLPGLRVEFPTFAATDAHVYLPEPVAMNFKSPVDAGGHFRIMFASDVIQPDYVSPKVDFDATQMKSIQFHVPTTSSAGGSYDFTVSNLAAIMAPM